MPHDLERTARALQGCLWEIRTVVEAETHELTEAQRRLDVFVAAPSKDREELLSSDLFERLKTLIRTNEHVLRLLYDAFKRLDQLEGREE